MFFVVSVKQHHVGSLESRKIATVLLCLCRSLGSCDDTNWQITKICSYKQSKEFKRLFEATVDTFIVFLFFL